MASEYRIDPATGDWRIVAPERSQRPTDLSSSEHGPCPFCPGNESMTLPEVLRVPADPGVPWRVRVVPNKYPVVSPEAPALNGDGRTRTATGLHEVVIESPEHRGDLRFASAERTLEVLRAMRERCRAMTSRRPAAVIVFRNHGAAAGTSLRHPHSQIVCLDLAPPGLVARWQRARVYFEQTGRCLPDDLAAAERREGVRVVAESAGLLVYQPRAGGVGNETLLMPEDSSPDLAGAADEALEAVAGMLPAVAAALADVRDDPAYNLVVHTGPVGDEGARSWYRWHIGLYPRVSRRAGLEIATGLAVNPAVPEQTAPVLRAAVERETRVRTG